MSKKYKSPNKITGRNVTDIIGDRGYYDIESTIRNRLSYAPQFVKRLELDSILEGHSGCVNCLEWSSNGRVLASASDDLRVILWDPFKCKQIMEFRTPHHGNIFSVKYLPHSNDSLMVTGAADGEIYLFDINQSMDIAPIWKCSCHYSRVKRIATAPDSPHIFWSAAEDGIILQFDKREKHVCRDHKVLLIGLQNYMGANAEAKCIAINQLRTELLAVGANDVYARVYDRRMISLAAFNCRSHSDTRGESPDSFTDNIPKGCVTYYSPGHLNKLQEKRLSFTNKAITYLTFSPNGNELLVNMGGEQIYLYDINNAKEPEFLKLPQFEGADEHHRLDGGTKFSKPEDSATDTNAAAGSSATESATIVSNKAKLPKHVENIKRLGNDYLENEKYTSAIDQYTEAIKILPNHPVFFLNRATAYMRRNYYGDVYGALRDCMTALKLDPTYVKAHFRMARALFELGYVQEASDCLEELQSRFMTHATNSGVAMLKKDIQNQLQQQKNENLNGSYDSSTDLSANELYWRSKALDYAERFVGHCNTTTDIKEANFIGNDGAFVIAGSDDGNFFIWERPTGTITNIYRADSAIVNCVQPNPHFCMIASSGIDHEVRLWCPQPEENYEAKNRIDYTETPVVNNQQRMQTDPFDLNGSSTICRSS